MDGLMRSDAKAYFGVSGHAHHHWGSDYAKHAVASRVVALSMLLASIFMAVYSSFSFAYRGALLKYKMDTGYDNRVLPVLLTVLLSLALMSVFVQAWTTFQTTD